MNPIDADRRFFATLVAADIPTLDSLLADDFILVDVMHGAEVPKAALLELMGSGRVKFDSIEPSENRVRHYENMAIVTGRTLMRGRAGENAFTAKSRYTHVYLNQGGEWKMVSAQGTQIQE